MKKYKLICMSFDGDYVTDSTHETIGQAWDTAADLGSKWFFYPFSFVCTEKTIIDTPEQLTMFAGRRIKTVKRIFSNYASKEETEGMDCEEFILSLIHN